MENDKLRITEMFHSLQGEGMYVGTPMLFIRLAGCTVGKAPITDDGPDVFTVGEVNSMHKAWQCRAFDGRHFHCDTDFTCHRKVTVREILEEAWEKHICLTGGEPLMHLKQLESILFFERLRDSRKHIHIETSGTIDFYNPYSAWISCSPKYGYLPSMVIRSHEIKLLVDENFNHKTLGPEILQHPRVYLQPINGTHCLDRNNFNRVLELLKIFPQWQVSVQMHKLLGMR